MFEYTYRELKEEREMTGQFFLDPICQYLFCESTNLMGVYRLYFLHNVTLLNKSLFTQSLIDGGHGQAPPGLFQSQTSH